MKNWKTRLLFLSSFAGGFMGNVGAATPPATLVSEAELRACGHGKEREIAGPSASNPSIKLISVSPAGSSYVSRDSTIVAELEYSYDGFEPGMYQLNAQFETTDPQVTTGGGLQEHNCAQMPGRFADGTFDPAQRIPEAYQRVSSHLSP